MPKREFEDFDPIRDTDEYIAAKYEAECAGYFGSRSTGLFTPAKSASLIKIEHGEDYDIAHFEIK